MPTFNEQFSHYLSGYIDGEGCFSISIRPRKTLRVGWEVRPSFSVGQNKDRLEVLVLMKDYFGCGTIRAYQGDNTVKFETRNIKNLINKIIPHFEKYPLLSGKKNDFEIFRKVCLLVANNKHLTREGLSEIAHLVKDMNISGTRDYLPETILRSLR